MTEISKPIPTFELTAELLEKLSSFVSVELRLLRAELAESSTRAFLSMGWLAAGLVFFLAALLMLLDAADALLVRLGLPPDLAYLIIAVAAMAIGLALSAQGISALKSANFTPARSLEEASSLGRTLKGGSDGNE
jgi:hypothetical protein